MTAARPAVATGGRGGTGGPNALPSFAADRAARRDAPAAPGDGITQEMPVHRRTVTSRLAWLFVAAVAAAGGARAAAADLADVATIPHRHGRITIDGDLTDWRGDALTVTLREPAEPPPVANTGTFRLVWDRDHLWFAAEIADREVYAPPPQAHGSSLYQWDSIELYVDGHGDRTERMDADDFQLIVACDGRYAVLQGDAMLRTVEKWEVPKREQPGLVIRTAARRVRDGYIVEGEVPFAAIGVSEVRAGALLALDLAWNDWTEDHPRLPELLKDLENLAQLIGRESEAEVAIVDPDSVGWAGLLDWEARAYRAWSWRSADDLGRPTKWAPVRLAGGPSLLERLDQRWGTGRLLVLTLVAAIGAAVTVDLGLRRLYRRRVRELLARIASLEVALRVVPQHEVPPRTGAATPARAPAPAATNQPAIFSRLGLRLAGAPAADAPPPDAVGRLLAHVRDHVAEPLPVGDVAAAIGVSPRTLQRACQDELGASPRDVILAVKMQRARDLLAGGGWRVSEVAERIGFDSPYHFSRRFKDLFGQPPSAVIPTRHLDSDS